MTNTKRYRVCSDNSVLNYFAFRGDADRYLTNLIGYNPEVGGECYVEMLVSKNGEMSYVKMGGGGR